MKELKLKDYRLLDGYVYNGAIQVYLSYFEKIPSCIDFCDLHFRKLLEELQVEFKHEILAHHYELENGNTKDIGKHLFVLNHKILIEIDSGELSLFFGQKSALFSKIENFTLRYKKNEPELAQINLITMQQGDFQNRKIDFKKPDIELDQLYNNGFPDFHDKILGTLNEEDTSGLHLLYGIPGTGKSTYIRYLCGILKKKVIFLPGQLAQNLDNVYMTRYLISNSNSILVIEDAEELIVSRDQQRNSNLAMILNMTDGILGESLGIQIIATFNTDLKNIDPALKRKGRLKSSYEFKPLESKKANQLLKNEGLNEQTSSPLTLADIYNFKEEQQMKDPERKAVGFR